MSSKLSCNMLLHSRPSLHLLSPGHCITLPALSSPHHPTPPTQPLESTFKITLLPETWLPPIPPLGSLLTKKLHPPCCFSPIPICTKGSSASPSTLRALAYAAPSAQDTLLTSPFLPEPSLPSPPGSPPRSLPLLGYHGPQGFCTSESVALSVIWHQPPDKCYEGLSLDPPCGLV